MSAACPRPGRPPLPDLPNTKTSIDLELDLAAQQSKLAVLSEEIERLRQIKAKMEEARDKGGSELPAWFQEDEKFQTLLASVSFELLPMWTCVHPYFFAVGVQERTKKP